MLITKKESFFWISYSDLMTSVFFIMLVLFILNFSLLNNRMMLTQTQVKKIKEIEEAIKNIDSTYFEYNNTYKKHVLKIRVNFPVGISDINVLSDNTKNNLIMAGRSIQQSLHNIEKKYPYIKYLLIIEGQASRDNYPLNYQLSYDRALSLKNFWMQNGITFSNNCEVLISGSGIEGVLRDKFERNNQRFLIHIIPKPGVIE
jgi:outer membrane protein OmpA-like peptidoglycan-associated protein